MIPPKEPLRNSLFPNSARAAAPARRRRRPCRRAGHAAGAATRRSAEASGRPRRGPPTQRPTEGA
eukprot:5212739-Pleurochrysis_carterae.AAC.1